MPAKNRTGYLKTWQVSDFFLKRLKTRRLYLRAASFAKLAVKDKAFILAESLKKSGAAFYSHNLASRTIIPIAVNHPVHFAMGLGKSTTAVFFRGMGSNVEFLFKALHGDVGKFVNRIFYKDEFAIGVDAEALGRGISENLDSFIKGMGAAGLKRFDGALIARKKKLLFLRGFGNNYQKYLDVINKL